MPSLLPGYEYDIFISYRHNDNRSGWVTEFVKALQEELAATIKDPVSVYFDTNPHDGLLETHNVDKSLEGKLKCLIFIPIISQTYCDPKSFAWQYEFCAYNKLAKEDQFGKDIKLGSGNVASRILPVKIHEVDEEDKSLLEHELGGVLRAIDFTFKSAGVNRPLTAADRREDNISRTFYRDQVNKVANGVKEIVTALKANGTAPRVGQTVQPQEPTHNGKRNLAIAAVAVLLLAVAGYFLYPKLLPAGDSEPIDRSIAVLPFENMSGDPEQEYFSDGITEEILNALAQLEGLKVAGRTSSFQYKGKHPDLKEVGEKLSVSTILEGSVRKQGDQLRITVQLITTKDGYHLWSQRFDRKVTDIFAIQDEIAQAVSSKLKITFLDQPTPGRALSEHSQQAYDLYLKGRFFINKRGAGLATGLNYLMQSLALDSTFAQTYAAISLSHALLSFYYLTPSREGIEESKKYAMKAIQLDPNLSETYAVLGFVALNMERDWDQSAQYLQRALALNPNNVMALTQYGNYRLYVKGDAAGSERAELKAIEIDPFFFAPYTAMGGTESFKVRHEKALEWYRKSIEVNFNSPLPFTGIAVVLMTTGKPEEAIKILENNMSVTGRTTYMLSYLCQAYAAAGRTTDAKRIYDEVHGVASNSYVAPITLARVAVATLNLDEAFQWYDKAFEEKNQGFQYWKHRTNAENNLNISSSFVKDPRYKHLMDKLAFPE